LTAHLGRVFGAVQGVSSNDLGELPSYQREQRSPRPRLGRLRAGRGPSDHDRPASLTGRGAEPFLGRAQVPPLWRRICLGSGLLLISIALFSPIGHIAEELVIAHMVEHLLIGDLATLLLVLGLTKSLLQPILAIRLFNRLQIFTHPLVALPLWALNFYLWHVPALYDAAYGTAPVHALEPS
jgi:putative membrane protein